MRRRKEIHRYGDTQQAVRSKATCRGKANSTRSSLASPFIMTVLFFLLVIKKGTLKQKGQKGYYSGTLIVPL